MSDWAAAPETSLPAAQPQVWDSAPLAGPTPQQRAVVGANDNGDEAAKAVKIAKETGIPAPVVASDVAGYDEHARRQAAIKATDNPYISKYIGGNPMGAAVSGDDYPMLDEVSQHLQNLEQDRINGKAHVGLFQGIPEMAEMLTSAPGREKLWSALKELPGALVTGLIDFAKVPGQVQSGDINLNEQEGLDKAISFGLDVALGTGGKIKTGKGMVPEGAVNFDTFMSTLRGMKTREEIDAFLRSKAEADTPPGALLQIEKAKAGSEALDAALEVAQESKTKVRSPDMFEEFAAAHGDTNLHIDANKVMELYQREGKVPVEGDGLLGFIPDLAQKVAAGVETGGEVTVPLSKYLAHVDPAVHEGLKDSVRLHDDGVTLEEAEAYKDAVKAFDTEAKPEPVEPEPGLLKTVAADAAEAPTIAAKQDLFLNQLFKEPKAVGLTEPEFKKYSDKIEAANKAMIQRSIERDVARRTAPAWKANEATVRAEVEDQFAQQGRFAAQKYIEDNKIELTPEVADQIAPLFGYGTGSALQTALKGAPDFAEAVKAEISARMEAQFGNRRAGIVQEARELALSDDWHGILAEEVRILAKAAGGEPALGYRELVDWAKSTFDGTNVVDAANWEKMRRAVERGGREAEKALLKGDVLEAFKAKQRQMLAMVLAKESISLQKEIDVAERKIDRFSSEEVIKSIDQAHLEQIRQMLASVGVPQQFAPLANTGALRDFVADAEGQIAVAPWLMDGSQPKLQDMTVQQFRDFMKTMKSLEHVGRMAMTVENARGKAELQNVVFDIKKELERFDFIDQPQNPSIVQRTMSVGRRIIGAHLLIERMLDYTDQYNPHGPLTEWLDRPLRDSNSKEIVLTEQVTKMLRDLKKHVDPSINELIENDLIPDAMAKSGLMQMSRANLRQLMLNTGNWSNLGKTTEGFGINEADLRRFIDKHANANDVAAVNGIWAVFDHLKPEADAMQLRDTGVPVDKIEPQGWEVKAGKLNGGYYPLVYDKMNSDIVGHMAAKNPIFAPTYVSATTPHGYTEARTGYKGALDLTGSFLASRIQGMIHDIAFREAVRNANKLISNQEFRTALAQRWGVENAELLPGWLKDIANSHTLDDNYAQGIARSMALVRQNTISTLIAFNPGTFIKHGFTAMLLSMDRVGVGPLAEAVREIGVKGAAKTAKDLVTRNENVPDENFMQAFRDTIDQGERGENARQFILDSSPVMRNRNRQYEDSIRGAVDAMNKAGTAKMLADTRQQAMLYGRLAVAYSDGMSAMPTWLAAYRKAYLGGETHADAAFIADKEVSRTHGSNFVGDQPLVTRIQNGMAGEVMRWFVPLYRFWNHVVNSNLQLAWDVAATVRGPKPGYEQEPGANAANISKKIAVILATIYIEEQASAALDEDKKGFLHAMAMSSLRYFGGGIVGLREATNALAGGYEPSVGLLGTVMKSASQTAKDIYKSTSTGASVSKDWLIHTATAIGMLTGIGGTQVGKTGSFIKDLAVSRERPRTFNEYRQGLRTGHSKARKF